MKFKNIIIALSLTFTFSHANYTVKIPLEVESGGNLPNGSIIIGDGNSQKNPDCLFDVDDYYWYEQDGVPVEVYWNGIEVSANNPEFRRGKFMVDYGDGEEDYEVCYLAPADGTENLPEGDNVTENGVVYKGTLIAGSGDSGYNVYYGYNPDYFFWQDDPDLDSGSITPKTNFIEDPVDEDKVIYSITWHRLNSNGEFFMQIVAGSKYTLKTISLNGVKFSLEKDYENHNLYTVNTSTGWPYSRGSYSLTITADVQE